MCEADIIAWVCETETRTARKAHRCMECGGAIVAGEKYIFKHGICDGPFAHKFCALCVAVGKHLDKRVDYIRGWGCLAEDCAEELPPDDEGLYQRGRAAIEGYANLHNIKPAKL